MTDAQIQALKEPSGDPKDGFSEEERAAIRYARLLTAHPSGVLQEDLDAIGKFFSAEQIIELTLAIATANLTNRFNDGLRTPVDT